MTVRPQIDEETVERVNDKVQDVMRVEPESVGLDTKINVLLDKLEETERNKRVVEANQTGGGQLGQDSRRNF